MKPITNITAQLSTLRKAEAKGFKIDDSKDFNDNYENAQQFIMDNMDKYRYYLLEADAMGERHNYMRYELPVAGQAQVDGELDYNQKARRWEHITYDSDGTIYLVYYKD